MASICNHTWIPECGLERNEDYYRLFLDECDMYEYNCDYDQAFDIKDYKECFMQKGPCPPPKPCPSVPTCPNHAYHRMNDRYVYLRRSLAPKPTERTMPTPPPNLPAYMLRGKRYYTPKKNVRRHEHYPPHIEKLLKDAEEHYKAQERNGFTTPSMRPVPTRSSRASSRKPKRTTVKWETKIIKTSIFMKNGKRMVKIVRGIKMTQTKKQKTRDPDSSGFLE